MRIRSIEFKNYETGLEIEDIKFNVDITLLVGLSGVGKTQILSAIGYTFDLIKGRRDKLFEADCKIKFELKEKEYTWEYSIKKTDNPLLVEKEYEYHFKYEKLTCNDKVLLKRNENKSIKVDGFKKLPTPRAEQSIISQYAEDDIFREIYEAARNVNEIDLELSIRGAVSAESFVEVKNKLDSMLKNKSKEFKIQDFSQFPIPIKLYLLKEYFYDDYVRIFDSLKELFGEINDISVKKNEVEDVYVIAIEVYGKTIEQHNISNGMLKSLYYIIEWMTLPQNSLVLIDEFENGLGVNCIDVLAESIIHECPNIQFIITSHHPKIINQIDPIKWKVIDRKISTVTNIDAEDMGIGNSRHEAYYNLINRWEYEGRI